MRSSMLRAAQMLQHAASDVYTLAAKEPTDENFSKLSKLYEALAIFFDESTEYGRKHRIDAVETALGAHDRVRAYNLAEQYLSLIHI